MKRIIALAVSAAVLMSCAACGEDKTSSSQPVSSAAQTSQAKETIEAPVSIDYQAELDKAVKQFNFEGAAMISKDGKIVAQSASGAADDDGTPITMDSMFCIASVSKQFTAAAVMMLQEQGSLSVDDTLDKYFPEYEIGRDITVKNLLTMRSGVADYFEPVKDYGAQDEYGEIDDDPAPFTIYAESDAYDNKLAIKKWLFNEPLNFEPNAAFEYSNSNFFLLSEIVEQASGMEYHDFLRENIFEPLGMAHTAFIDDIPSGAPLAKSKSEPAPTNYPGVASGAGDIVSTAGDMDIWLTALRENTLLSKESFSEMTTNYSEDGGDYGYGYGVMIYNGSVMHAGEISTYRSVDFTSPSQQYNLFAVTNNGDALLGSTTEMCISLVENTLMQ